MKLLVMTALEDTWGDCEPVIFLGEWCKRYELRDVWSKRRGETVKFHWDDRAKLRRDYDCLAALHQSLLGSLTQSLNELHRVDYSARYWQILLDPWLMTYLSAIFDRWECLRIAFEENNNIGVIWLDGIESSLAPFSYAEFIDAVAYSDEWNQCIYQRIIKSEYSSKCSIQSRLPFVRRENDRFGAVAMQRQSIIRKAISFGDRILGRIFTNYDVIFVGATFKWPALIRLNMALGQVPRFFLEEFHPVSRLPGLSASGVCDRADLRPDFQPKSRFEEFIKYWIIHDLPRCLVEDYAAMRNRATHMAISTKAIATGSSHWVDAFVKMWVAEQVNKGVKLVILEHGGSLPPYKELFDFEADIADIRVSWFLPYHLKHVRLPPPKIVGRYTNWPSVFRRLIGRKKYCSFIGNECPRWAFRAHFYPMAYQWSTSFNMTLLLYGGLSEEVKEWFRVKPYPSQGWNTRQRFMDILGFDKIFSEKSLDHVYSASKVIVCSYPETTFSEAMASGVPTILIYPEHLYELNPVALPLLESLKAAKIVFHDPMAAAAHLNAIWADPSAWWGSPAVLHARSEFHRQALGTDRKWLKKWVAFLRGVVA
ncbi:MAG: LIC12162 family protein [Betaproteobacteria bacterium]|nr:LIC12162 family protein [Betaproteobacteria bacterium]